MDSLSRYVDRWSGWLLAEVEWRGLVFQRLQFEDPATDDSMQLNVQQRRLVRLNDLLQQGFVGAGNGGKESHEPIDGIGVEP